MLKLTQVSMSGNSGALLQSVSLELVFGEKAVICGPSGCGKSSLLRAIAGFRRIDGGSISINGLEPEAARHLTGFMPQTPVPGAVTVCDALLLPYTFRANADRVPDTARINAVLSSLGLPPAILEAQTAKISGGEMQRVAIAREILLGKQLLLADEISSALDRDNVNNLSQLLKKLPVTLLAVSHDEDFIAAFPIVYRVNGHNLHREER